MTNILFSVYLLYLLLNISHGAERVNCEEINRKRFSEEYYTCNKVQNQIPKHCEAIGVGKKINDINNCIHDYVTPPLLVGKETACTRYYQKDKLRYLNCMNLQNLTPSYCNAIPSENINDLTSCIHTSFSHLNSNLPSTQCEKLDPIRFKSEFDKCIKERSKDTARIGIRDCQFSTDEQSITCPSGKVYELSTRESNSRRINKLKNNIEDSILIKNSEGFSK